MPRDPAGGHEATVDEGARAGNGGAARRVEGVITAPYGSWRSPITAEQLVERVVALHELSVSGETLYWNERRPAEAGRQVVVRRSADGEVADAVPEGYSARTTVHEYGGGSYVVHGQTLFFSNFTDQRVYRLDPGAQPRPITPDPPAPGAYRYADGRVTPDGAWLVCARERHLEVGTVVNDLVAVPAAGGEPRVLAEGHDFFAAPRLSPDGRRLAWLSWDHPCMPWDGTELWVCEVDGAMELAGARLVAGGPRESVSQPHWSPEGVLHWVSDRTGWWNLYSKDAGPHRPLAPMEAEFSGPDWTFGQSTYTFLPDGRLVAAWTREGVGHLGVAAPGAGRFEPVDAPYTVFQVVTARGDGAVAIAASPLEAPAVVAIDVTTGAAEVLRSSREQPLDPGFLSEPRPLEFPTEGDRTAHALYYPPTNRDHGGPPGELPPLLVTSHGGPTGAASPALNLATQFWTSRGFAVVDVNYGGSTGYGRAYRERLAGRWGVVDVDDCVNAALHLGREGEVDVRRLAIRGGSAGGYTTLCALTFRDVFAAGASYYGVADLEALAIETHKFESRYLDGLIGPYPEARELYRQRSPIHFADRLACPLILFQGLEDKVVPPQQAEVMVEALRAKGVPFAYLAFEGEQHGFRSAATIKRAAEAELSFYGEVLGFEPADDIDPVPIENLEGRA